MELRKISDLFWKLSPNMFFLSAILGVVTGLAYGLIIPLVMYAVSRTAVVSDGFVLGDYSFANSPTTKLGIMFIVACLLIVVVKFISSALSLYIANKASMQHRLVLYRRIRSLALVDLERIGQAKIINILNIDISAVTNAADRQTASTAAGYLWTGSRQAASTAAEYLGTVMAAPVER